MVVRKFPVDRVRTKPTAGLRSKTELMRMRKHTISSLQGSFSAVSRPIVAEKMKNHSSCNIFKIYKICALLRRLKLAISANLFVKEEEQEDAFRPKLKFHLILIAFWNFRPRPRGRRTPMLSTEVVREALCADVLVHLKASFIIRCLQSW